MDISKHLAVWNQLKKDEQDAIAKATVCRHAKAGEVIHDGTNECTGLILVYQGQLRAFILSPGGREVTLYRLLEDDFCMLSASCMLHNAKFDITIQAEKDTDFFVIPADVYQSIAEKSPALGLYTNEVLADRMSDIMWLIEQILWESFDKRLATFLIEESSLEGSNVLNTTHETIANHLGTAREVVTRMLRYFQSEDIVKSSRGSIEIKDAARLKEIAGF